MDFLNTARDNILEINKKKNPREKQPTHQYYLNFQFHDKTQLKAKCRSSLGFRVKITDYLG